MANFLQGMVNECLFFILSTFIVGIIKGLVAVANFVRGRVRKLCLFFAKGQFIEMRELNINTKCVVIKSRYS